MVSFFQTAIFLLAYVSTFTERLYVVEAAFPHFFRITTSTQQLLFRGSYFCRAAAVFSFFRTVTFLQELFFQNSFFFGAKILQSSHFLRIGSSLRHLLFGTTILSEELFRIKISKKELLFQSRYFCTASTFSEKLHFGENRFFRKSISALPAFSGELSFQSNYLFKRHYFP